jgi:hypothetical protein
MLRVLVVYLVVSFVRVIDTITIAFSNAVVMLVFLDLVSFLVLVGTLGLL